MNPVFILGAHKSGTTLVSRCLDSHPKLFVPPFEPHTFYHYYGHSTNTFASSFGYRDFSFFKTQVDAVNTSSKDFVDKNTRNIVMMDLDVDNIDFGSFNDFFTSYFVEIANKCKYDSLENKIPVEKSVFNEEYIDRIHCTFDNAKFIRILRNPYSHIVSLRRYFMKSHDGYPTIEPIVKFLKFHYSMLYRNSEMYDNYIVIRYEDLIRKTKNIMEKLASFLDILFNESMLVPTIAGLPWYSNSSRGIQKNQIFDNTHHWKNEIYTLEAKIVEKYFDHILDDFKYPVYEGKVKTMPILKEGKNYFRNRLSLYWNFWD